MKVMELAHHHHLGSFSGIKSSIMHEGESDQIIREDGSVAEIIPKSLQSNGVIPVDSRDIEEIELNGILKALQEVGRGLADAKAKMILESIEEATKEVGNHIGPRSDSAEQFFEMIEKRYFDFDAMGRPIWGEFVVGDKETAEKLGTTMNRIESTPELKRRMSLLIEQKRREFLDREAARKLVD
jgi:hypothetical protein